MEVGQRSAARSYTFADSQSRPQKLITPPGSNLCDASFTVPIFKLRKTPETPVLQVAMRIRRGGNSASELQGQILSNVASAGGLLGARQRQGTNNIPAV